mmetsp:Transcript_10705/g.16159  ORF Transcript_10705/g.16159 Transcript_10705/m.16159 type:complete len:91 (+) Transcript_10705:100-372(+)
MVGAKNDDTPDLSLATLYPPSGWWEGLSVWNRAHVGVSPLRKGVSKESRAILGKRKNLPLALLCLSTLLCSPFQDQVMLWLVISARKGEF